MSTGITAGRTGFSEARTRPNQHITGDRLRATGWLVPRRNQFLRSSRFLRERTHFESVMAPEKTRKNPVEVYRFFRTPLRVWAGPTDAISRQLHLYIERHTRMEYLKNQQTPTFVIESRPCPDCNASGLVSRFWPRLSLRMSDGSRIEADGEPLDACRACGGARFIAPWFHFDGRITSSLTEDVAIGDGCAEDHRRVAYPCETCGKALQNWRHQCTELAKGKPCNEHHVFTPGRDEAATREGCREHDVDIEFVYRWWGRAREQGLDLAPCECCLTPARGLRCKRCAVAVASEVAA